MGKGEMGKRKVERGKRNVSRHPCPSFAAKVAERLNSSSLWNGSHLKIEPLLAAAGAMKSALRSGVRSLLNSRSFVQSLVLAPNYSHL